MTDHYPVPRDTITFDTADDLTILPGTIRVETVNRCGCTYALEHEYGTGEHRP